MLEMATVRWSVPETVHYSLRNESTNVNVDLVEYPNQVVTLEAGRIYQGLPYTHGIGNYHSFAQFREFPMEYFTTEPAEILRGSLELQALAADQYHCTHKALIVDGR